MQNNQAGEVALSWVDSFIRDLLTDEEKYQDAIKDLSDDAIKATLANLDQTSDQYWTGLEILQNRATSSTSAALIVVDEDVNEDAADASGETDKANKEADAEADEKGFDAERATSMVLIEIDADISRLVDEIRENNEGFWGDVQSWFGERFSDLDNLFSPLTDLFADGIAWLFALPAQLLFESFKSFFFEETEE